MAHWKTVAKNQLRLLTSRERSFRLGFFIIVTIILFLWAFFGAPALVSSFVLDLQPLGGLLRPVIGVYMDFIFLMVFAFFLIYPLIAAFQTQ